MKLMCTSSSINIFPWHFTTTQWQTRNHLKERVKKVVLVFVLQGIVYGQKILRRSLHVDNIIKIRY